MKGTNQMEQDLTIYDVIELPTYQPYAFSRALGDILKEEGAHFISFMLDNQITE
jgi:hypothetical protein